MPQTSNVLRKSLLHFYQSNFTAVQQRISAVTFPQRLKGTIVEKWAKYWKNLFIDYQEVFAGVGREAQDKPLKALIIGSLAGSAYYCSKTNPDKESFVQHLRNYQNEMSLVNESLHNPVSRDHILMVERNHNSGQLRRLSLGVISFMWLDDFSDETANYRATCSYLKPDWSKFHQRIIDIGFLGQWWNFRRKMTDYDIGY